MTPSYKDMTATLLAMFTGLKQLLSFIHKKIKANSLARLHALLLLCSDYSSSWMILTEAPRQEVAVGMV